MLRMRAKNRLQSNRKINARHPQNIDSQLKKGIFTVRNAVDDTRHTRHIGSEPVGNRAHVSYENNPSLPAWSQTCPIQLRSYLISHGQNMRRNRYNGPAVSPRVIAAFGEAQIVRTPRGRIEIIGGSPQERAEARSWAQQFLRRIKS